MPEIKTSYAHSILLTARVRLSSRLNPSTQEYGKAGYLKKTKKLLGSMGYVHARVG
jgi:hypothetical protein